MPAHVNTDLSGSVCCPLANTVHIMQAIPLYCSDGTLTWWDALTVGQGYRPSTIVGGLMFHVHLWISFIHRSIECRFYHPCDRTGYAGFSIQARFLNLVSAVLSLNSLCQFILCINNLFPQEVISFGMFYHLFCCLNHAIQSFSMMLRSVILRSFPMFGFSS